MTVLVTGGAGFIGSNLVDALVARGERVLVVDDLSTGCRANLDAALGAGARLHELDVTDAHALAELILAERPELVFHLAAQVDVRRATRDPAHDALVNISGTINVLAAAHAAGVRRVVYSGTGGAVYGDATTIPTPEDAPAHPISPYGQSKLGGESYCELFARLHGLSTVVLRYANVYGPRQDPLGEGGVIAILCGCLASARTPTIYGDGRQTRDFVHVDDVVDANLRAATSQSSGPLNIGTGVETSVLELVETLDALGAGPPLRPRHAPARPGEVRRSCLDPSRAASAIGWMPRTTLADGLRATLEAVAVAAP